MSNPQTVQLWAAWMLRLLQEEILSRDVIMDWMVKGTEQGGVGSDE